MKIQTLIAAVVLSLGGAAFAQAPAPAPKDPLATPRLDRRQAHQQKRIDQGVASGQLTPRETARMDKRQDRIAADETKAKADGKVTAKERRHLRHEENHASQAIYRQKHDRQTVAPAQK